MKVADGPRQIGASLASAGVFLGLFFGVDLVWWVALPLAAVAYGGLLLLVPRKPPETEIMLGDRVSAADLRIAARALEDSARRISEALPHTPRDDHQALADMSAHLLSIREQVLADPRDYRSTRRFITSYLPNMVRSVEAYGDLNQRARGKQQERIKALGEQIHSFGPVVEQIDRACLENDFTALEAEVDALGTQLARRY